MSTILHVINYRGVLLSTLLHAISHRGVLLSTILHAINYRGALLSTLLHAFSYRGALLSTTCHCITLLHSFLNILVQIANKMGFKKKEVFNNKNAMCEVLNEMRVCMWCQL
jgi:hypothetical protein